MPYSLKVILNFRSGSDEQLEEFVEKCLRDGVKLVAVMGERCEKIEETIDWLVVGDVSDDSRFLLTSAHPGESLQDVLNFAKSFTPDYGEDVEIVEI